MRPRIRVAIALVAAIASALAPIGDLSGANAPSPGAAPTATPLSPAELATLRQLFSAQIPGSGAAHDAQVEALLANSARILAQQSPAQRAAILNQAQKYFDQVRQERDPLAPDPAWPATATPQARAWIAAIAGDDAAAAAVARRELLASGEDVRRALIARAAAAPAEGIARLRLRCCAQEIGWLARVDATMVGFTADEPGADGTGTADAAEQVTLLSRSWLGSHGVEGGLLEELTYYSFPTRTHGFGRIPVSLACGNPDGVLTVRCSGGQENAIIDCGAGVMPPVDWHAALERRSGPPQEVGIPAIAGHWYVERCVDRQLANPVVAVFTVVVSTPQRMRLRVGSVRLEPAPQAVPAGQER